VPPKDYKFEYWRTSLAMDRGQELIKMDISNKLKTMQYEPEYDTEPVRERDEFVRANSHNWRDRLMEELGIIRPFKDEAEQVFMEAADGDQDFYEKFLEDEIFGEGMFEEIQNELIAEGLIEQPLYEDDEEAA
jgi:hypothetical protein